MRFYLQSASDEHEEHQELFNYSFQIVNLLVVSEHSKLNTELFQCFSEIFWKSTNLEIVMGALVHLRKIIEFNIDDSETLKIVKDLKSKLVIKWLKLISRMRLADGRQGKEAAECQEVGPRVSSR